MPLNASKYVRPETRRLINSVWDDAWRQLKKGGLVDAGEARQKLATTITALASAGETDPTTLKWFALHATRGALQAEEAQRTKQASNVNLGHD
jgi:hypothetical protein